MLVEEEGATRKGATLLGGSEKSKEILMIISDDLSRIRVYEKKGLEPFHSLDRISTNASTE